MMKHIFIINPISGSNKFNEYLDYIEEAMNDRGYEYEIILTQYKNHAAEITAAYSETDDVILYVLGGDGTIHDAINGIKENVPLAIIPVGTGNDFYRYFEVDIKDIKTLLDETIEGYNTKIDIGLVNNQRFINCFSMGFDAEVSQDADELIRNSILPNKISYMISAARKLLNPDIMNLSITIDDEQTFQKKALIMAIMNGKYYGGGFKPTPSALLNDKQLDLCIIDDLSKPKLLQLLPAYTNGTHVKADEVMVRKFKKLHIESDRELVMEADGEGFTATKVEVSILENFLTLRLPDKIKI